MSQDQTTALRAMADGMEAAAEIMRSMAREPSIALLDGPAALRIVADAVAKQARAYAR